MTPKEKAKELIDKMYGDEVDYMTEEQAKQCALIAVDEIIASNPNLKWFAKLDDSIKYWQEVKTEIELL
jgi:glutaredoxin-related protein